MRKFIYFRDSCITIELSLNQYYRCGGGFLFGGEDSYSLAFRLAFPYLVNIFIGIKWPLLSRLIPKSGWWGGYETGVYFYDRYIDIHILYDEGQVGDYSGYHKMINIPDILLGKSKFKQVLVFQQWDKLYLPEGEYIINVKLLDYIYKRPRWFRRIIRRCEIDTPDDKPILAHSGKGENSWDMDDGYVFSYSTPAKTIADGIEKLRLSILRDREKYGWPSRIKMHVERG